MIRKNLLKAVMIGLCMASMSTGSAFAMEAISVTPAAATEEASPEMKALYQKQKDIDKILFEKHVKDIEQMGFFVSSTGIVDGAVEISISPLKEDYVEYIRELVGKDDVRVVEMDESILYATGVAPDQAVEDGAIDEETKVYKGADTQTAEDEELAATSDMTEEDGEVNIQIESTGNLDDTMEAVGEAKTVSAGAEDNIQTISAQMEEAKKEGVSVPVIILAIAGGAILIGGLLILSFRKKV